MEIRHSTANDLDRIMEIYKIARKFMADHGNPNQWGPTNWPPRHRIQQDIETGRSYVCVHEDSVVGTFFYDYGKDVEPGYLKIEDGQWRDDSPYSVVHRIATDGTVKGVGHFCLSWALNQQGHMRIDTHSDNIVMRNLLNKMGFEQRGIIYVEEDNYPRFAFEKTL